MYLQLFNYLHQEQSQCLIFGTLGASQKFPFPCGLQLLHLKRKGKHIIYIILVVNVIFSFLCFEASSIIWAAQIQMGMGVTVLLSGG